MKIFGKVLGSIYTVIFGVVLFAFLVVMFLGQLFVPDYYTNLVKDMDLSSYKVKELDLFSEEELKDYAENTTLEDYFVLELVKNGIAEKEAKEIVNDVKVRELYGEILGNLMSGLSTADKIERLTIEEVKVAFKKYDIDEDFYTDFVDNVNEHYAQNEVKTDDTEDIRKVVDFITGSNIMVIFLCFLVFSYLIMVLMTWSLIKPFKYLGFPVIAVGIALIVCKFAIKPISAAFASDFKGFLPLITNHGATFLTFGLLLIVMGITIEVLYLVLRTNLVLKKTIKTYDEEPNVVGDDPEIETENDEKQV